MAGDLESLKQDLDELRGDIGKRFDSVHTELKELTKALRDLVRIDGDQRRIEEKVNRIGSEVGDHEKRIRHLERSDAGQEKSVGLLDWIVRHAMSMGIGGAIGAALLKAAGG